MNASGERTGDSEGVATGEDVLITPEDGALALPQPTAAIPPGGLGFTAEQGGQSPELTEKPSGYALPIWQLQLSFAGFAVLMAGAWFLLQRRLTA